MSLHPAPQWTVDAHKAIWKEQRFPFETTNDVEHLLPYFATEMATDREPRVIMVREEYRLIWEAMRSSSPPRTGGLIVWGQPGIGKSMFLSYALSRALYEQLPVALCDHPTTFLMFNGSGVNRKRYDDTYPDELPKGTIALFDTTPDLERPTTPFVGPRSQAYVVQATSPTFSRWREWAKQKQAQLWPMKPWERAEVEKLCNLMDKNNLMDPVYYTPLELFDIVGPSVRLCFSAIPKGLEGLRASNYASGDVVKDLPKLREALQSRSIPDDQQCPWFHMFFYAFVTGQHPRPIPWYTNQSSYCQYYIPTRFLRDTALAPLRMQTLEDQNRLLSMFAPMPKIAGLLYEVLAVDRIATACGTCKFADIPEFRLPAAKPASLPEELPDAPGGDMLYTAPEGHPSIGAVAVTADGSRVTMLQMTIAKRHSIKALGINIIVDPLGDRVAGIKLTFVSVVPSDDIGRKLAAACGNQIKIRSPRSSAGSTTNVTDRAYLNLLEIPVGWLAVPSQGEDKEVLDDIVKYWEKNVEMEQDQLDED